LALPLLGLRPYSGFAIRGVGGNHEKKNITVFY